MSRGAHLRDPPGSREQAEILSVCWDADITLEPDWAALCSEYLTYCEEQRQQVKLQHGPVPANIWTFPIKEHKELVLVVSLIRMHGRSMSRGQLRAKVRTCCGLDVASDRAVNAVLDFALRLWLMINFRDTKDIGVGRGRPCVTWPEDSNLVDALEQVFEKSTTELTPSQRRLSRHFMAVNLVNICRVTIKWTTSLEDHLRLDSEHRTLYIFSHRQYLILKALPRRTQSPHTSNMEIVSSPLPVEFLEETGRTLDLLFPSWDNKTQRLLQKMGKSFHMLSPRQRLLDLKHYPYWRDRLLEVYEGVFQADPEGIGQLWRDRRDPQKFWTFWVAMAILVLTIVSTITTMIQTWAAVRAMNTSNRALQ